MVLSTMPVSKGTEVQSPGIIDGSYPVTVQLRGNWDDVKAVVDHWRIEVEWRQAVSRPRDECAVDGLLNVRG